jgi:hypothetical protein
LQKKVIRAKISALSCSQGKKFCPALSSGQKILPCPALRAKFKKKFALPCDGLCLEYMITIKIIENVKENFD